MVSREGDVYLGVLNASQSPVEMTWMNNVMKNYSIKVCILCVSGHVRFLGFRRWAFVVRAIVDCDFYVMSARTLLLLIIMCLCLECS